MKSVLEELWKDWTGRLFLINLANHLECGILTRDKLRPFYETAKSRPKRFESRYILFSEDFPGASAAAHGHSSTLHMHSHVGPSVDENRIHFRVAPLGQILSSVRFAESEPKALKNDLRTFLSASTKVSATSAEEVIRERQLVLLNQIFRDRCGVGADLSDWPLPNALSESPLRRARLNGNGLALRNGTEEPVFAAPLTQSAELLDPARSLTKGHTQADAVRDALGLDHYDRVYMPKGGNPGHVVLGFFVFREKSLKTAPPLRPTPFDITSPGRFRASFGDFCGKTCSTGRTADLAKISAGSDPTGYSEVVFQNEAPANGSDDVLIGLLGEVRNPRSDAFIFGAAETVLDTKYLAACAGPRGRDTIIDIIVSAK